MELIKFCILILIGVQLILGHEEIGKTSNRGTEDTLRACETCYRSKERSKYDDIGGGGSAEVDRRKGGNRRSLHFRSRSDDASRAESLFETIIDWFGSLRGRGFGSAFWLFPATAERHRSFSSKKSAGIGNSRESNNDDRRASKSWSKNSMVAGPSADRAEIGTKPVKIGNKNDAAIGNRNAKNGAKSDAKIANRIAKIGGKSVAPIGAEKSATKATKAPKARSKKQTARATKTGKSVGKNGSPSRQRINVNVNSNRAPTKEELKQLEAKLEKLRKYDERAFNEIMAAIGLSTKTVSTTQAPSNSTKSARVRAKTPKYPGKPRRGTYRSSLKNRADFEPVRQSAPKLRTTMSRVVVGPPSELRKINDEKKTPGAVSLPIFKPISAEKTRKTRVRRQGKTTEAPVKTDEAAKTHRSVPEIRTTPRP